MDSSLIINQYVYDNVTELQHNWQYNTASIIII